MCLTVAMAKLVPAANLFPDRLNRRRRGHDLGEASKDTRSDKIHRIYRSPDTGVFSLYSKKKREKALQ